MIFCDSYVVHLTDTIRDEVAIAFNDSERAMNGAELFMKVASRVCRIVVRVWGEQIESWAERKLMFAVKS